MADHTTDNFAPFFDQEFYQRTYAGYLKPGQDPLDHYLKTGSKQGFLPSRAFDPVRYRVERGLGPAEEPLRAAVKEGYRLPQPRYAALFPEIARRCARKADYYAGLTPEWLRKTRGAARKLLPGQTRPRKSSAKNLARCQRRASRMAEAGCFSFKVDGRRYTINRPEPRYFLERLADNRRLSYARLSHGVWDALVQCRRVRDLLEADARVAPLNSVQRRALAIRICDELQPKGLFAEKFLDELEQTLSEKRFADDPEFFQAIAFGDLSRGGDALFRSHYTPRDQQGLKKEFGRYFRPEDRLYDAFLWKRLLVAGYLKKLPALCRERRVILLTSDRMAGLKERWQLKHFEHVVIPPALSHWQRRDILKRLEAAISAAEGRAGKRGTVVLTCCGGSLAYWLISRLHPRYRHASFLDLGQALQAWFMDVRSIKKKGTLEVYGRAIIENCGWQAYYAGLMGKDYPSLYDDLF